MKSQAKSFLGSLLILGLTMLFLTGCVAKEPVKYGVVPQPEKIPTVHVELDPAQVPNPFHTIVGIDFVKPFICDNVLRTELRKDVVIIDSRPKRPRYDRGHIPTAISIPDSQFDELKHTLPADKSTLLIFYCGGLHCPLSHNSAWKASEMGYTNIAVYAEGDPEWVKEGYKIWTIEDITEAAPATAKAKPEATPVSPSEIKQGPFEGSVDADFFKNLMATDPNSIQLIDVRGPEEYAIAHIPSSKNMTVDQLEANINSFTDDKPIIFICSTGARSGEAFYMFMDMRPDLENVYYIDAEVSYSPDGSFTIE